MITIKNLLYGTPKEKYDFRIIECWSELYNPYMKDGEQETEKMIKKFKTYFQNKINEKDETILTELAILTAAYKKYGQLNLFCHCDKPCHGDVIKSYILKSVGEEETKMDTVPYNEETKEETPVTPVKRGRGRPKGSKNKTKEVPPATETTETV